MRSGVRWLLSSRWRVVLVTLAVLLALDLGRSLYARVGYAEPVSTWQPSPSVYADIAWPPGSDLPADAPLGQKVLCRALPGVPRPRRPRQRPGRPSLIPRPAISPRDSSNIRPRRPASRPAMPT